MRPAAAAPLVAERMFRALTDVVSDPRGVRRPCALAELAAVADASEADVAQVVEVFRQAGTVVSDAAGAGAARLARHRGSVAREPDAVLDAAAGAGRATSGRRPRCTCA